MIKSFAVLDEKLGNRLLLIAVRRGLIYLIPLLLLGSFALFFLSLPLSFYQDAMDKIMGDHWRFVLVSMHDGTFNIMALLMVLSVSYSYVAEYRDRHGDNVSPIIAALVSLGSFIAISGFSKAGFSIANFGVFGVFVAIIVAVVSSKLFLKLSSFKFLRIKAFSDGANSTYDYAVTSIYPAMLTIIFFALIKQILTVMLDISDIQNLISNLLYNGFSKVKSPFWSGILFIFLIHILWLFGMHGSHILEPVAQKIFVPALTANQTLIGLGQVPTEIFTKTFFDTFVLLGGCGATLCLIIAVFIVGRHRNQLRLSKLSFILALFNINELIVFGMPIVLNPIYMIPFLCIPVILTVFTYLAVYYGLVPYTINLVEWTTPIFLSGYASTQSINGSLMQLFNLVVGTICYMPFVRLAEGVSKARMGQNLQKVYTLFNEQNRVMSNFTTRYDDVGNIARFLTADLEDDLQNKRISLFYQPQVDYEGNVFGAEALLRWKHNSYGYIYPPLAIALAEESGLMDKLGYWILETACSDLERMNKMGIQEITVSVNVSAVQLESDSFIANLEEIIKKHHVKPGSIQIEITEQLALANNRKTIEQMIAIKNLGVKIAMDDFGMGHSSLMYLKEYDFDTIKLDGSLVHEILTNNNCRNIISSIVLLGKSLNYTVLAEYVENEEQKLVLHELGCEKYQGYLFSEAIPYEELIKYIFPKNRYLDYSPKTPF
ncbi:MAG: PTS sugar transporter subunit IIC/EAL domain-containing protein [Firmicutes bacterium]|nr:PTS sugar transporter subunit IIC/EAL domain-containing protein [Bacillota bacterium]